MRICMHGYYNVQIYAKLCGVLQGCAKFCTIFKCWKVVHTVIPWNPSKFLEISDILDKSDVPKIPDILDTCTRYAWFT